jgi:hypothetical protein
MRRSAQPKQCSLTAKDAKPAKKAPDIQSTDAGKLGDVVRKISVRHLL